MARERITRRKKSIPRLLREKEERIAIRLSSLEHSRRIKSGSGKKRP